MPPNTVRHKRLTLQCVIFATEDNKWIKRKLFLLHDSVLLFPVLPPAQNFLNIQVRGSRYNRIHGPEVFYSIQQLHLACVRRASVRRILNKNYKIQKLA
jgi:hypothetical protein